MTSTTNASDSIYKESEFNIYTFNEQNVIIDLDKNDAFVSAITSQLAQHFDTKLTNEDVVLYKLPDAEINFMGMCRICLASTNIKNVFDIMYEGILISNLLMEFTSISVQENDVMPKDICDTCILELINCYRFKKKCLQSQSTLEEIIKYSNTRPGTCWNDNTKQTPFILHNLEYTKLLIKEQETTRTENCIEQETTQAENCIKQESGSNLNEKLNELKMEEEDEVTIQNTEEESGDLDLLPNNQNTSDFENKEVKDVNEQIKKKLSLICPKCGDEFQTSEELEKHRKEVRHPSKTRKLACQICGKLYVRFQLELHMRTHTKEKPYVCRICSRGFSLKRNLKRHLMIHTGERPHICHICGKGFIQSHCLSQHMCTHTGEKPILCDVCGKGFNKGKCFNEHKCIKPASRIYKCKDCDMTFNQSLDYRKHMQCHQFTNGELDQQLKEFQCVVCHKVFNLKNTLKTHMLIHGEKTYFCGECGKGFHIQAGLLSHMKVHTGEKPYSCSECGKCFSHYGSIKSHMLIHSGQRPYNCEICLKSFVQRNHLKYHMRTHSGEKPYKCSYCNKCFALKGNLTIHIRSHTGETPHVCDVCGRGFYDSSSMKKHQRGHGHIRNIDETSSVKS